MIFVKRRGMVDLTDVDMEDISAPLLGLMHSAAVGCCVAERAKPAVKRRRLRRFWVLSPSMLAVGGGSAGLSLRRLTCCSCLSRSITGGP